MVKNKLILQLFLTVTSIILHLLCTRDGLEITHLNLELDFFFGFLLNSIQQNK